MDWNSSSRSLRSSSRLHQQHSGLSGGGSGTSQTHHQQQHPPTHANHNHMSGVPQPPPPASTSRSAHKGTTITTAVTPEETPTTRRSKRISTMAHNPYHGSEYPSSSASGKSKSLLASRRDFHGNPEKRIESLFLVCMWCTSLRALVCHRNSLPIAQRPAIECVSRMIALRLSMQFFFMGECLTWSRFLPISVDSASAPCLLPHSSARQRPF